MEVGSLVFGIRLRVLEVWKISIVLGNKVIAITIGRVYGRGVDWNLGDVWFIA